MSYVPLNPTMGCVTTRDPLVLEPGELVRSSGIKLKKNDSVMVHADEGLSELSSDNITDGPLYLSFEGSADYMVYLDNDDLRSLNPDTGLSASLDTLSSSGTAITAIHRGAEWFVGTNNDNFVIRDGVVRGMGGVDAPDELKTFNRNEYSLAPADDSDAAQFDVFSYFFTAYDEDHDVETEVFAAAAHLMVNTGYGVQLSFGAIAAADFQTHLATVPARFDKLKIYRHYWGRDGAGDSTNLQKALKDQNSKFKIGGLLDIIDRTDTTYDDEILSRFDGTTVYPLTYLNPLEGGKLGRYLGAVRPFTVGALFQDCLVVNDPGTSKQVVRYSVPGLPEYQPEDYLMYFAGEGSDEVVGIHNVGPVCVVLTTGSAHRINYLPLGGRLAQGQGEANEEITSRVGCVGRRASVKVESEGGDTCVWLSDRGLEWTNGRQWSDACPDFSTDAVTGSLSSAVLVADTKNYRIRLFVGTQVWDFYYHPSQLKGGRLKMMGPTDLGVVAQCATRGPSGDTTKVWVASDSTVYVSGGQDLDGSLTMGYLAGSQPFLDIRVTNVGITHTAAPSREFVATGTAKLTGEEHRDGDPGTIPNPELHETGRVSVDFLGQWYCQKLGIEGSGGWSAGPIWLDLEFEEGNND